jgi:ABC-type sugar transport system ATPase subunit
MFNNLKNQKKTILSMQNVTKIFPGIIALDNVNFNLREKEIHAIIGANGAGKSTLVKILSGMLTDYRGNIYRNNKKVKINNPRDSIDLGINAVEQELNIFHDLTISENVFINNEIKFHEKFPFIDRKKMDKEAKDLLKIFNLDINPKIKAKHVGIAVHQIIELLKILIRKGMIIILDEPTAVLTKRETNILFETLKELKEKGISIIFISHRIVDVFDITDRITVLRDGKNIGTFCTAKTNKDDLIRSMLGIIDKFGKKSPNIPHSYEQILKVSNVSNKKINDISFSVNIGEIVGFAGPPNSGVSEIFRIFFGLSKIDEGEIILNNNKVSINSPRKAITHGIGLLTADRRNDGLFPLMPVYINIMMPKIKFLSKLMFLKNDLIIQEANRIISALNIKVKSEYQNIEELSGGNQQKVIIARWLSFNSNILLFEEPTRGIDIHGKNELIRIINDLKKKKKSVLIISTEIDELIKMADRILVFGQGKIIKEIGKRDFNKNNLSKYIYVKSREERIAHH